MKKEKAKKPSTRQSKSTVIDKTKANRMAYAVQDMLDGLSSGIAFNFKEMEEYFFRVIQEEF